MNTDLNMPRPAYGCCRLVRTIAVGRVARSDVNPSIFAVTLMGSGCNTQGVVMCNQPRTIDLVARAGRFVEDVEDELMEEVLARLQPVFAIGG